MIGWSANLSCWPAKIPKPKRIGHPSPRRSPTKDRPTDPLGHLQFVRSYVATDGVWSLATEVEIEATADGGDLTWALDPYPYETWRRDRYRR